MLNSEEIVVKPLSNRLKAIGLFSGATILGDGQVALILDVQAIGRRALRSEAVERATESADAATAVSEQERVLVAGIGEGRQVAVPLSSVTRLEQIPVARIERVGHREVVQYRGQILPLLRLGNHLGALGSGDGDELLLLITTSGTRSVAIVVDEIVDIADSGGTNRSDIDDHGLVGSTVVRDRVVEPARRPLRGARRRPVLLRPHRRRPGRRARARPPHQRGARMTARIATFTLDGRCYGVPVDRVQEVLRSQVRTPVPLAPPAVAGLVNLRGQVLTAIDLRARLGLPERSPTASRWWSWCASAASR
ncbi:hypothetical protein GCM10025868_41720 [Angustibacter aerolatus]|uniref:CheW-like domain-containing protein n=1 Tax=Angustibacter aerolatus TaxID=1162965 RepID=A0ABQ6JQ04_9ACTN|nr:chemotaxis protein CheW [Angustibacter aerolatus]GMA88922.1 hypothetical protein GCM10025868_41720 [Angustibacter aerolatus]